MANNIHSNNALLHPSLQVAEEYSVKIRRSSLAPFFLSSARSAASFSATADAAEPQSECKPAITDMIVKPVSIANRAKFSDEQINFLNRLVDSMLGKDMIERSLSKWNSPVSVQLASRKIAPFVMTIDYKNTVNEYTIGPKFSAWPKIESLLGMGKWKVGNPTTAAVQSETIIDSNIREYFAFTVPGRGKFMWKILPYEKKAFNFVEINDFRNYLVYQANEQSNEPVVDTLAFHTKSNLTDHNNCGSIEYSPPGKVFRAKDLNKKLSANEEPFDLEHLSGVKVSQATVDATVPNILEKMTQDAKKLTPDTSKLDHRDMFIHLSNSIKKKFNAKDLNQKKFSDIEPAESNAFEIIDSTIAFWFANFNVNIVVGGIKQLKTDFYNTQLISSFLIDAIRVFSNSIAVPRTGKLLAQLLSEGLVSSAEVLSSLADVATCLVDLQAECAQAFIHFGTIYGILMEYDSQKYTLKNLHGMLAPFIEQKIGEVFLVPDILSRVLMVTRLLNRKFSVSDVLNCDDINLKEFWPTHQRQLGKISDWLEINFFEISEK
ncbi:hypothetical protein HK100_004984 [Physocladia obscura]|uniref:Uncharacterized protein n=1 Tax=Physocladia obscura TaxID=109957 RepID=A0AAD5XDJ2_9FUNG|nr:hypothetical protein HK100_004984 [Physocladia obscura]